MSEYKGPRIGSALRPMQLSPGKEAAVTRESKLALIIGFVLVLLVGVLVSDHFSQASSMALDTRGEEGLLIEQPIAQLGPREQQAIDRAIVQGERPAQLAQNQPENQFRAPVETREQVEAPIIISNSNSIIDQAIDEARRFANETHLPAAAQPSRTQPTTIPADRVVRTLPDQTYIDYRVVSGDSLIGIARRLLGDGERWREIESLNANQLGPDSVLQIGMTLKLPSDARMLTNSTTKTSNKQTTKKVNNTASRSYTVKSGDTLGEISQKLLGTSKRMGEIVELNGLSSADEIFVGMTLKIPAK